MSELVRIDLGPRCPICREPDCETWERERSAPQHQGRLVEFPMTPHAVIAYRGDFRTPISPVAAGDRPWVCFSQRGTHEFFVHPEDARRFLADGILIGGTVLPCELSSTWAYPHIGAVQIVAKDKQANQSFIEAAAA